MPNIITDPKFAPARQIIPDWTKKLEKIHIRNGLGSKNGSLPPDKQICIMEATAYILGYEEIDDAPPCTSEAIREFMIDLNDTIEGDRKRAQLKKVIPDIINTAPTINKQVNRSKKNPIYKLVQDFRNSEYKEAEKTRNQMIEDFGESIPTNKAFSDLPMTKLLPFIRELAAVAKFDTEPSAEPIEVQPAENNT